MYFKQFYLGCLAHASYMIGSNGEAAVVDPQRDVDIYLEEAQQQGLRIRHVIETHLHADFVSGHRELAGRTGAKVYFGAKVGMTLSQVEQITVDELNARLKDAAPPSVLDVRRAVEWQSGHIAGAIHIPLHALAQRISTLTRERPLAVICAGGYRSSTASSILERNGFKRISNVVGGMSAWTATNYETST